MAYTETSRHVTVEGGLRVFVITITETDADNAQEVVVYDVPEVATLRSYKATLQAGGTGTTIRPELGRAAAFATNSQDHHGTISAPAAHQNDKSPLVMYNPSRALYFRSKVDAGSDNTIVTELILTAGTEQ